MPEMPAEIRSVLTAGEHALWWGRPRQGLVLRGSDLLAIPFSLMWCGFAIFWEASVVRMDKAPTFMMFWGIPFVLVGLHIVIGRFFVEAWQRSRTWYALTPDRVVIVSGLFSRTVKSLSLGTLAEVSLTERSGGKGSILFGSPRGFASAFGGNASWPGSQQQVPCFDLIDDAKTVYERIRSAQKSLA